MGFEAGGIGKHPKDGRLQILLNILGRMPAASQAALGAAHPIAQSSEQLSLTALGDNWGALLALGAEVGASSGGETFQYGIAIAGLTALDEPSHFELAELTGSARLSLTLRRMAGLRVQVGAGLSSLVTMPEGAMAESRTALGAAFLELRLSRPIWFGALAVLPSFGARAFSARRRVRVDGEQRFDLSALAPQLGLSLMYRL